MATLGVVVLASAIGATIASDSQEAVASELERFSSCGELARWTPAGDAGMGGPMTTFTGAAEQAVDTAGAGAPGASRDTTAAGSVGTGDTNVVVAGVDELDVIDRIDEDRALVVVPGSVSLVALGAGTVLARVDAPYDARVTFDADAGIAWVAGSLDTGGAQVQRVRVGDAGLSVEGAWSTTGWLVDARRTGDRLHVVASEGFAGGGAIPFEGGPVPCDQVLHPPVPSGPEATLLVTLPATGEMSPTQATEVVGSGQFVHVTGHAAFLATPLWAGDQVQTSLHRFDLATLTHTGSGRVQGTLLNPFSMSEYEDHLRVAVTRQGAFPGAIASVADPAVETAGGTGPATTVPSSGAGEAVATAPATTVVAPVDGGVAAPGPTSVGRLPAPAPASGEPLNEIVVLDVEGDLDVVGRTPLFGHPGETLHGIRFEGPTAFAVTFLQTDPFYVVSLSDPAAPRVVGEVELPGFSSYLHPVGDGLVAGFGPGEDGRVAVRLFDVSDPARPRVTDTETLGDDSAVAGDHHAYLDLGNGRFAVPATTWRVVESPGCTPAGREQRLAEAGAVEQQLSLLYGQVPTPDAAIEQLSRKAEAIYSDPCVSPPMVVDTDVVVAGTAGASIGIEERLTVRTTEPGTRVLQVGERWGVLAGTHLLTVGPGGDVTDLALG